MSEEIYKKVHWRLFLNTSNPRKARKITKQVIELLNGCSVSKLEPYWKNIAMYDLELETDLSGVDIQNVVFELINTISLLSGNWQITRPLHQADHYELSGVTDRNLAVVGVQWASFSMY